MVILAGLLWGTKAVNRLRADYLLSLQCCTSLLCRERGQTDLKFILLSSWDVDSEWWRQDMLLILGAFVY